MQQYLVTAIDGTDAAAPDRRTTVRADHFVRARELKASGNFITGGAILNEQGQMIGSMMVVQFSTEQELQAWLNTEPYIMGKVWEKIEVRPFKVADV
ncbi:MAG TPA: YciI family protein [Chitinophagaceae bacterium]|nr:YciI family protein [Chitinophagaceae bacterium]